MTFDEFDERPDEFNGDDFDPVVAERFALFEAVATPSFESVTATAPPVAVTDFISDDDAEAHDATDREPVVVPLRPSETGVRTRLALAAAAVAVVAAGTVGLVAANGQDQPALQTGVEGTTASEPNEVGVATDAGPDASLVVEVPEDAAGDASSTATTVAGVEASDGQGDNDDAQSTDGQNTEAVTPTTDPVLVETDPTTDATAPTETTGSTEVEATSTTVAAETTSTTQWASTTTIVGDDVLTTPVADKEVRISGTVSEVFTDCVSRLVLSEAGQVQSVSPVSCDGGSYIVVNGRRIQTTAGYGLEEDWFGDHPQDLLPGQRVTVIAVEDRRMGGILSLDCVRCKVTLG